MAKLSAEDKIIISTAPMTISPIILSSLKKTFFIFLTSCLFYDILIAKGLSPPADKFLVEP